LREGGEKRKEKRERERERGERREGGQHRYATRRSRQISFVANTENALELHCFAKPAVA
jgi:hypothetical protein